MPNFLISRGLHPLNTWNTIDFILWIFDSMILVFILSIILSTYQEKKPETNQFPPCFLLALTLELLNRYLGYP